MAKDNYVKLKVHTLVSVLTVLVLGGLSIFLSTVIADIEFFNWKQPTFLNQLIVVVSTTVIILSVNVICFCFKDTGKVMSHLTGKKGVLFISCVISAVFCIVRIRTLLSFYNGTLEEVYTLYPYIGYFIVRNIVTVFISVLAYKNIMKIYSKPQKTVQ